ncbi:MAG: uroporphyrinogen decarboxylase [Bacteroidetes bacterium QH_2_64_26]|nr:MAG: uroporphyrinogen decarboxylase [Bacteroidetes bacterium QH_2_64_26]
MASFPPLRNDLILRTARGETTDRTPVWMMRQAGRYLPEYREIREEHDFFEVVETPELAAEVTIQPVERFPLDAAILFCDIMVVPEAMGLTVKMVSGQGPTFPRPLTTPDEMERLVEPDIDAALGHVFEALTTTRKQLNGRVPLIGFAGAPWTLMAYMVEGSGSKSYRAARRWLYRYPEASKALLQRTTDVIVDYLIGQVEAGAQMLQVFDSWAGLHSPERFRTFCLPYLGEIAARVKDVYPEVPLVVFAKGAYHAVDTLADTNYDVLSLDWRMAPSAARKTVGDRAVLQGNLDPCALYAPPDVLRREVRHMLAGFGPRHHIANLGHGMLPDHDPEHARVFVETVHEHSEKMRTI